MLNPELRPHVFGITIPLKLEVHLCNILKPFRELRFLKPARKIAKRDAGQTSSSFGVLQLSVSYTCSLFFFFLFFLEQKRKGCVLPKEDLQRARHRCVCTELAAM